MHQNESLSAQLVRKLDRRGRAGREIAREIEPTIICDDVISRLAVRACLQSRFAGIADREGARIPGNDLEIWEKRQCRGGLQAAGGLKPAAPLKRGEISGDCEFHPRVLFEPLALRFRNVRQRGSKEIRQCLDFAFAERDFCHAVVGQLRELGVVADRDRNSGLEGADQCSRRFARGGIAKIDDTIDFAEVAGELVVRNIACEDDSIAGKCRRVDVRRGVADDQQPHIAILFASRAERGQHDVRTFRGGQKAEEADDVFAAALHHGLGLIRMRHDVNRRANTE